MFYSQHPVTARVSALLDHVYPALLSLDRELEEAELLSRCYSLPYTIEEIGAAFMAIRKSPKNKVLAMKYTREQLMDNGLREVSLRFTKALVDAVAERIGAYQGSDLDATPAMQDRLAAVWIKTEIEPDLSLAEWRLKKGVEPTRRVLGRDLAEIERDAKKTGRGDNFFLQMQNTRPMGPDEVYIEGDSVTGQRRADEEAKAQKAEIQYGRTGFNIPVVQESRSLLDGLTQRAIDGFLSTGAQRAQALRGFLRFLAQEDIVTVLTECVVRIDDEHLGECVKMLGPDEVQALNDASAGEISTRAIDMGGMRGFPLRPLEGGEHGGERSEEQREPTAESKDGNFLLEKDVQLAVDTLDWQHTWNDNRPITKEEELAEALERRTGWNSIYAGEVAEEAWKRYYKENREG